jgi:hypothetical protein
MSACPLVTVARALARCAASLLGVPLLAVPVVMTAPGSAQAASDGSPAAQQLAEKHAPVIVLRRYDELCSGTGEPFVPMTVDPVLGNPEVALRQVGNGDPVIKWAPTAKDLYGRGQGVYLNFAGEALRPGCVYATDSARYTSLTQSAVYAHIAQQPDRPGFLAVQYWIYWYYNDWNNKHESDWEFIQVLFRASSVDQALTQDPVSVGYAQHEGGEVSDWTSDKLEHDGTHPVVYSSQRSHASYVQAALYLGRGASEGFGCDNTQTPSTRVSPSVVVLPDAPSGPDDPFAWLAFNGRWGERQSDPNNGPTGPTGKPRWSEPVTWQEGLREGSFAIPGGSAAPPAIVSTFCTVVGKGSVLFIEFMASPAKVLLALAVFALVCAFLVRRTSWRRVDPLPLVARRRTGEIVRASASLYRQHPTTFAVLGLIAVPVGLLALLVSFALRHLPFVGSAVTVSTDTGDAGSRALISSTVAAAFWPLTIVLVSAAVAYVLGYASPGPHDRLGSATDALTAMRRQARDLASSFLLATVIIGLASFTVIGLPVAVWFAVRFTFLGQVVMLQHLGGWKALERTSRLVRHRWWHTALVAVLVWAAVNIVAVLVGLLLLVTVTELPLWAVTAAVFACQVILVPLAAIVLTLLYGDACAQHKEQLEPADGRVLAGA